jgi:hypothetical protein
MRLIRRVGREGKYRRVKGECPHVWRTRSLAFALSGATCEVCERCGVLQVLGTDETDEPGAPVALHRGASALRPHEGTALGSIA